MMSNVSSQLLQIYDVLTAHYGPQGWWPADSRTETIVGTILVQHTAWTNVERAIANLKAEKLMDFRAIHALDHETLAQIVRPAGTPTVKARRLQAFAAWLAVRHGYVLESMLSMSKDVLRSELLKIKGIGPETADCIMLYAAEQPAFVIDTYTRRVLSRHLLVDADWGYDRLQSFLEANLPRDVLLFNEFHALLVEVGKKHCRKTPVCVGCPLEHLEHNID
jgi:endonuclease-3 related protein